MKGIADTGFLVAFASQRDRYHDWAMGVAQEITEPLLTCESVLSEAAFHLGSSSYVLKLVEEEMIRVAFEVNRHLDQLGELARRYADRNPDFADLCLIRMSEIYPRHALITTDAEDFRVYRRNKRDSIPLVCPTQL